MISSYLFTTLGLAPYFASRAFVPLFATVFVARFGYEWALVASYLEIELLDSFPPWAISDGALTILGLAALFEIVCTKSPEIREMFTVSDPVLKGFVALSVALLLAPQVASSTVQSVQQAGFLGALSPVHVWVILVAGMTFLMASLRNGIYGFLIDLDEDDDLGLQKLLSWLEDGIGFLGVLFVVILPTVALIVAGLTLLGLFLLRKLLEHRERRQWKPCTKCETEQPPCGFVCAHCGAETSEPLQVGWMGTIRRETVTDSERHRLDLLSGKRCRRCGHRLQGKEFDVTCEPCGAIPFETEADLQAYIACIQGKLPKVLGVLLIFSALPVVGLIPGVIYYRLSLIASLRHYIPRSSRIFGRWVARVVSFLLVMSQPIPFFGAFALPLMALINFWIYRRLLVGAGSKALAGRSVSVVQP